MPARSTRRAWRTAGSCCASRLATSPTARGVDDVAAELADLAGATLEAALAIARPRWADAAHLLPARRDRDGQVRRPRAQLRQRRRRRSSSPSRPTAPTRPPRCAAATALASAMMRVCSRPHARGHALAGRRGAAARGQGRPAGPHARQPRRLLRALGQDLGVPGAAQGPAGRRRPGARARRTCDGVAPLVWAAADATGLRRRRAGDAPPGRVDHIPRRRGRPAAQARAAAGCATSSSPSSCCSSCTAGPTRRCAAPTRSTALEPLADRRLRRPRRRRRARPRPTGSCARSSTGSSCTGCGARTSMPDDEADAAPARPRRSGCASDPVDELDRGVAAARAARCAGCTRSCSTGRCWRRSPGCPATRRGSRPRRPRQRLEALGYADPAARCGTSRR